MDKFTDKKHMPTQRELQEHRLLQAQINMATKCLDDYFSKKPDDIISETDCEHFNPQTNDDFELDKKTYASLMSFLAVILALIAMILSIAAFVSK